MRQSVTRREGNCQMPSAPPPKPCSSGGGLAWPPVTRARHRDCPPRSAVAREGHLRRPSPRPRATLSVVSGADTATPGRQGPVWPALPAREQSQQPATIYGEIQTARRLHLRASRTGFDWTRPDRLNDSTSEQVMSQACNAQGARVTEPRI
jgi:hypothetical protein